MNQTQTATPTPTTKRINLFGDRHIEWSWVAAHIPPGPGEALEFGPGDSWLALVAVHRGFRVTTIDLQTTEHAFVEPRLKAIAGDLLDVDLPASHYDLVINCSAVEHAGLAGRYGVALAQPDGDLHVMTKLRGLMKPNATMILTVPVGQDAVFEPMCRVYGVQRLPRLLAGLTAVHEAYWVKNDDNRWARCPRATALAAEADAGDPDWQKNIYGLGCFVLTTC